MIVSWGFRIENDVGSLLHLPHFIDEENKAYRS